MMGNDYVQWHGFYDVAKIFYSELLPEAEHLQPGTTQKIFAMPRHASDQWPVARGAPAHQGVLRETLQAVIS